jgi:WXG100 family type VII secretion target
MTIRVEHDTFEAVLVDVRRAAGDLAETRARAVGEVQALLDGGWSGAASTSFAEGWSDWSAAADDVADGLHDLVEAMSLARQRLDVADVQVQDSMSRLTQRLG